MKCNNVKYKVLKPYWDANKLRQFKYNDWSDKNSFNKGYSIAIRCGKCLYCKSYKKFSWQTRLEMETEETLKNKGAVYFITLTYNKDNLSKVVNNKDSPVIELQKWFKRLRKNKELKIKYFFVNELGSETYRLHHHGILFSNYDFLNEMENAKKINGNAFYTCKKINWNQGFHSITKIEKNYKNAISYVLKYLLKNPLGYVYSKKIGYDKIEKLKYNDGSVYIRNGSILKVPNYKNYFSIDEKLKNNKLNFYNRSNNIYKLDLNLSKEFEDEGFEDIIK